MAFFGLFSLIGKFEGVDRVGDDLRVVDREREGVEEIQGMVVVDQWKGRGMK